ncbi:MAG: hypothetical protein R2724_28670 [Bryobacterales bacterium]
MQVAVEVQKQLHVPREVFRAKAFNRKGCALALSPPAVTSLVSAPATFITIKLRK